VELDSGHGLAAVKDEEVAQSLLSELENILTITRDPMTRSVPRLEAGELRNVAVLFLDIQGFTALSARLKPEEVHKLTDRVFKIFTNLIQRHNGSVDKYIGDALLAVFGGKGKTEACCERAARAALQIIENVSSINEVLAQNGLEIRVRVGLNYGEVSMGTLGSLGSWDTVMGDTVNVAQRIQSSARPNTVLASKQFTRMLGDAFLYTNERDIVIKGKEEPLRVAEIFGENIRRSQRWERHHLAAKIPFVGRRKELEMLTSEFNTAKLTCYPPEFWKVTDEQIPYRNRFVGITGEAGFGKSRLAHEFFKRIRSAKGGAPIVLSGACPPCPVNYLYGFAMMIYNYLDLSPTAGAKEKAFCLEEMYRELLEAIPEEVNDLRDRLESTKIAVFNLLEAHADYSKFSELDIRSQDIEKKLGIRSLLEAIYFKKNREHLHLIREFWDRKPSYLRLSVPKPGRALPLLPEDTPLAPLIVFLDDIQFAQEATYDFIQFLLETTCLPQPMLFISTYRPDFSIPPNWTRSAQPKEIAIGRISDIDLKLMLSAMLDGFRVPLELESQIFEKCGGNPFFLEELVYYLLVEGFIVLDEVEQCYKLERSLKEFRIPSHLSDLALGRMDSLEKPLKIVVQKASVIGKEFTEGFLRELDKRLGQDSDDLGYLLEQLVKAQIFIAQEPQNREVDKKEIVYSFKNAIQQEAAYRTLLHHNRRVLHRIVAEIMEEIYAEEIDWHLESLAYHHENAGNLAKAAEYWVNFCELLNVRGQFKQASETLEHALNLIKLIKDEEELVVNLSLQAKIARANSLIGLRRHQEAEEICLEVGAIAKSKAISVFVADTERTLGVVARERHRYLNAEEHFKLSLAIAREAKDKRREERAINNLGLLFWELQRFDVSLQYFEEALKIARELGQRRDIAAALNNIGLAYGFTSGYKRGIEQLEQALAYVQEVGDRWAEASVLSNIGLFYANQGRYDLSKKYIPRAEKIRKELGIKGKTLTAWWV